MSDAFDLCQVPSGQPPAGQVSNFVDPTSLVGPVIGVYALTSALATIFTGCRVYANFRKLSVADYLAIIAVCISWACLGVEAGQQRMMRHIWDIPACFYDDSYAQSIFLDSLLMSIGAFCAKASIFLLFYQIFEVHEWMRIAIWIGQFVNLGIYASGVVITIYYDVPRPGETWAGDLQGRVLGQNPYWGPQSALSVALDVYIFVLPLPAILKLNLPMRKKLSIVAVFSLALLGIAVNVVSMVGRLAPTNKSDQSWAAAVLTLYFALELNVAILVSSAPGFSKYLNAHFLELPLIKSLVSSLQSHSKNGTHDSEAGKIPAPQPEFPSDPTRDRNHRYYELNDTWMLKTDASADPNELVPAVAEFGQAGRDGIVRTVGFEQREGTRTTSTGSLMTRMEADRV